MISSIVSRTLAMRSANLLALCCLLLLPSLPNAQNGRAQRQTTAPQPARSLAADRHQYQLLSGDQTLASPSALLFGNQFEPAVGGAGGAVDASEAQIISDLMNSFSERQVFTPLELDKSQQQQQHQQQQRDHGTPGHYAFEVAPKMEPPSAPRPPFRQANSVCPGSDPFGGFSARDTLCGDLYQGRVPLNPMGQSIDQQAYPFELIKNKTLQFLARSLPILKTEYETIPKVARYLPAHQLLNPTNLQSPLGHDHFHKLNQNSLQAPPFLQRQQKRRRRKRQAIAQHQASITVAEMMPNATLVVSSAHSAGRIGNQHHSRSSDSSYSMITKDGPRMIGSVGGGSRASSTQNEPAASGQLSRGHASSQQITVSSSPAHGHPQATDHDRPDNKPQAVAARQQLQVVGASAAPEAEQRQNNGAAVQRSLQVVAGNQIGLTPNANGQSNGVATQQQQQQQQHKQGGASAANSRVSSRSANSASNSIEPSAGATPAQRNHATIEENGETSQLQARSSATGGETAGGESALAAAASSKSRNGAANGQKQQQQQQQSANGASLQAKSNGNSISSSGGVQPASQHLKCANVNGLFLYSICQAASALVEGDSTPSWLQAAKQIGTLYSAASSTDSYGSSSASSNPIWSLWSAFAGGDSRSSDSGASNGEMSYKSSAGHKQAAGSSVASVVNLLNPLMSFFAPSLQRTSDVASATSTSSSKLNKSSPASHASHQSFSSNLKTISNLLLTGLSLAGLYDWLGASGALFSPTYTTFAKRKKPFDPNEQFVDTPASLAAMASVKQLTPGAGSGGSGSGSSIGKQPPTPCPSVEEYISPTFARNYQGAWKYVVQIPHEGYFTQTIQRSSCMRQKCEFTEGVCHEAPRWVSLLVAEIYYPNAIFGLNGQQTPLGSASNQLNQRMSLGAPFDGAQNAALLEQLMASSPSINNLQQLPFLNQQQQQVAPQTHQPKSINSQDPLQMTDSLSTYNHNLNSAFMNAANELGLDPTNVEQMQQLANAHNYQLMQRNGLMPSQQQQQPQIESRVSHGVAMAPNNNNNQALQQQQHQYKATQYQQQQQPMQQRNLQQQQQQFVGQPQFENVQQALNSDYIKELALEMLRQNPHLSVDELIRSLQLQQQVRKKRDLSIGAGRQMNANDGISQQQVRPIQHQHKQHVQTRSSASAEPQMSTLEGLPSMNAIDQSAPKQQQQQQQQQHSTSADSQPMVSAPQQPQMHPDGSFPAPTNQDHLKDASFHDQLAGGHQQNSLPTAASATGNQPQATNGEAQIECDGHDKIGCYVVRVYYDWFLVNGSCKCWKTNLGGQQQSSGSSSSGAGNASGSLIRRIFTG